MIETIEDFMVAGAKAASTLSRHVVEGRGAVSIRLDLDHMGELVLTLDLEPEDGSNCAATFAEVYNATNLVRDGSQDRRGQRGQRVNWFFRTSLSSLIFEVLPNIIVPNRFGQLSRRHAMEIVGVRIGPS